MPTIQSLRAHLQLVAAPACARLGTLVTVFLAARLPAIVTTCATVLVLAHPASAQPTTTTAAPRQVQQGAVLTLLRAEHPQVDALVLHRIGPDVQAILVEQATAPLRPTKSDDRTAAERAMDPTVRLRALSWLQFFPNATSRAVLTEVIRSRDVPVPVLRVALRALPAAMGVAALDILREHLLHSNVFVREAAAYGLGDLDDRRIAGILEDQLGREAELAVRDAIEASLHKIRRRAAK